MRLRFQILFIAALGLSSCNKEASRVTPQGIESRPRPEFSEETSTAPFQAPSLKQLLEAMPPLSEGAKLDSTVHGLSDSTILQLVSELRQTKRETADEERLYYTLLLELAGRDPSAVADLMRDGLGLNIFGGRESILLKLLASSDPETITPILETIAGGNDGHGAESGVCEALVRSLALSSDSGQPYRDVLQKLFHSKNGETLISIYFGEASQQTPQDYNALVTNLGLEGKQRDLAVSAAGFACIKKDPEAALTLFEQLDPQLVGSAYGALFDHWLVTDSQRAEEVLASLNQAQLHAAFKSNRFIETLGSEGSPELIDRLLGSIPLTASNLAPFTTLFGSLAAKDRESAARILTDLPPSDARGQLVRTYWAKSDVRTSPEALATLATLNPSLQPAAARGLLDRLIDSGGNAAESFVNSAPPESRSPLSAQLISHLNRTSADEAATMLVKYYTDGTLQPADLGVASPILEKAANANLARALSLAEGLPEEVQTYGYRGLMTAWSRSDPVAASEWLAGLPPSAARDAAALALIQQIEYTDPEAAGKWRATISSNQ